MKETESGEKYMKHNFDNYCIPSHERNLIQIERSTLIAFT